MKTLFWSTGICMLAACLLITGCRAGSAAVPDVTGQTQAAAAAAIVGAGLTVGAVTLESSPTISPGLVISQIPVSGTLVSSGTAVNLAVSQGPQPVTVPGVVGQTQVAAETAITNVLLAVGTVTLAHSATVPAGSVITQDPAAGLRVPPGSVVALVVSEGPPPVTVPDLVGQTQAAAETAITNALLAVGAVTQQYSATVPAGSVIAQDPVADTWVSTGSTVVLTVSQGPAPVIVPDVVGMTQSDAGAAIANALLALGAVAQVYSTYAPAGQVVSQNPAAGASVAPGSAVNLDVSKGMEHPSVPNVLGMTQAAATGEITAAGLTAGTVTGLYSADVPVDQVISQNPLAGITVDPGTVVTLTVSKGPGEDPAGEMVSVPQGTFIMGRTASGDDVTYGYTREDPRHEVTLGAYQIGKFDVTNKGYSEVLNWALIQGYLKDSTNAAWTGMGDIYAGGDLQKILAFTDPDCNIQYSGGVFSSKTRVGLPDAAGYPMDAHPVVDVSWYGAAAFCNWLSQMVGLTPCYDMTASDWPLTVAPPAAGGYRLPTEAEWERAAAWDGSRHWTYGFTSDTNAGNAQCNDFNGGDYVNPLGLAGYPYTSPVGWFNGVNVSPNGTVTTVNSPSPVGCYDMSGEVWQWCGDWQDVYADGPQTNPVGPATGRSRVLRGACWNSYFSTCRSAFRYSEDPWFTYSSTGFRLAKSAPPVKVTSFAINDGATTTTDPEVTLDSTCTEPSTQWMASQSADFSGAVWTDYDNAPTFTLSGGVGPRMVYFRVHNADGFSDAVSATIFLAPQTILVAAGTFTMGNSGVGEDLAHTHPEELPARAVTLAAYQIGKFEVTNGQYCDVLNWALAQGCLKDSTGAAWTGADNIYAGGSPQMLLLFTDTSCNIQYSGGVFSSKMRTGAPGSTTYPMDTHPVADVTWYGAVAFCNWLSQMEGLTPCYDMTAGCWPLITAPPTPGGYRLPTEAEWERAAAWDPDGNAGAGRHWIYGITGDTLSGRDRANYVYDMTPDYVNPLGLSWVAGPDTSPVGWFDGANLSPNGNVATVNSASPVGAYDMCGNIVEWCGDWKAAYGAGAQTNPTGPETGSMRVLRGGSWNDYASGCRSAGRSAYWPANTIPCIGFRLVR